MLKQASLICLLSLTLGLGLAHGAGFEPTSSTLAIAPALTFGKGSPATRSMIRNAPPSAVGSALAAQTRGAG